MKITLLTPGLSLVEQTLAFVVGYDALALSYDFQNEPAPAEIAPELARQQKIHYDFLGKMTKEELKEYMARYKELPHVKEYYENRKQRLQGK